MLSDGVITIDDTRQDEIPAIVAQERPELPSLPRRRRCRW